jgi:hypothetical protein
MLAFFTSALCAQNPSYTVPHDTCLDKKFSIVFYVVLDSNFVPYVQAPVLTDLIDTVNDRFKRICVTFMNCSTVYLPNYTWAIWHKYPTGENVIPNYYTPNTINVYLVDTIRPDATNTEGTSYTFPPTPANLALTYKDVFVIEGWNLAFNRYAIMLHLLGDYFGLPHTSAEINPASPATPGPPAGILSHEFVDGSNCAIHGDGFCDTDADPGTQVPTKDGKGDYYYPPIDNYMCSSNIRCHFTQEQYNKMAKTIITKRMYLH